MNLTRYYLNNHMYYLESIAELIKVYSSIDHQSGKITTHANDILQQNSKMLE